MGKEEKVHKKRKSPEVKAASKNVAYAQSSTSDDESSAPEVPHKAAGKVVLTKAIVDDDTDSSDDEVLTIQRHGDGVKKSAGEPASADETHESEDEFASYAKAIAVAGPAPTEKAVADDSDDDFSDSEIKAFESSGAVEAEHASDGDSLSGCAEEEAPVTKRAKRLVDDSRGKGGATRDVQHTAYVSGLSLDTTEAALRKVFLACGEIVRVSMPMNEERVLKGIAFLEFKTKESLERALTLNEVDFNGQPLRVQLAGQSGRGGKDGRAGNKGKSGKSKGKGKKGSTR